MKKRIIIKEVLCILLMCFILFTISSCSKKSEDIPKNQQSGEGDAKAFVETNEDLLTVDYKYFYNELASGGEWIEISTKDLGINIDPKKLSAVYYENSGFVSEVLGIKTVYAQTESDIFNLFVWRLQPNC